MVTFPADMTRFWRRLRLTLEMIKFEHSVFALPFALTGALLAWRESGFSVEGLAWRFVLDRRRHGFGPLGGYDLQSHPGCRYR